MEKVPAQFSLLPKAGFEIRPVEPYRAQSAAGGSYMRPSEDGSRPGVFYVNTYDLPSRKTWDAEDLFLHEAIPGHHFQLALQQELTGLPAFRRFGGETAFTEGWGLYAESLGRDMGLYEDPYSYFGYLQNELWRAIRLIVDTGLHSKGWTRQQVIDYMQENSATNPVEAVSEAERYMAIPGQGAGLQDRRTEDHGTAPQGTGDAGPALRRARLPCRSAQGRLGAAGCARGQDRSLDRDPAGNGATAPGRLTSATTPRAPRKGKVPMPSLLPLFALAVLSGAAASTASAGDPGAAVDALMHPYDGRVPGASVLVLKDGEPLLRRGYGLTDLEAGTAATPATNYRLTSVTKQFTAAAILLLAEDGKLSLDDPVKRWLPSLPAAADAITLRQLLSHTSGLIDYEDHVPEGFAGQLHDADVLHILEGQDRTYFAPGSAYRYSNSGYALLALAVGRASGQDFATFLRERIFRPLRMDATVAHRDGVDTVAHRAWGHSLVDGRWERTDQSQTSAVLGDGGIYSSIDDLARWDAALYDDRLLSARSRALMFTPATATGEPDVPHYGFGWRLNGDSTFGTAARASASATSSCAGRPSTLPWSC